MFARILNNTISVVLGAGFTLSLFLAIAYFLRAHELAAGAQVAADDLELVAVAMPPPPPPPKAEEHPVVAPEASEAIALGIAEEPGASPVKIAPSPLNPEELLPMAQIPMQAVAGLISLESNLKPTLSVSFDEDHVYQRSEVDKPPYPISRPDPPVPDSALGEGGKRSVIVLFVVDAHGAVSGVRVIRTSHNSEFDSIIAENVAEWTFSPAIKKGRPVRCMVQQQITVQLARRDILSL